MSIEYLKKIEEKLNKMTDEEFEENIIPIIEQYEMCEFYECPQCEEIYHYTCNSAPRKSGEMCFQCQIKEFYINNKEKLIESSEEMLRIVDEDSNE